MQSSDTHGIIAESIEIVREMSPQHTDGVWLEDLTVAVAPHIRAWDIAECWLWADWPERESLRPGTTKQDGGIDVVAIRRSDGQHVAIQCKSRQLDESGEGTSITKGESDSFANASSDNFWAERWFVTNGNVPLSHMVAQTLAMSPKPMPVVDISGALHQQQEANRAAEECPHCLPNPDGEWRMQTKTCMQNEAVERSVRILRQHEQSDSGGLPVGEARGKIILPCGTGKTRISLRIVEELTGPGELSIVLCPSIALVAQIRREYLQYAIKGIRPLAVCSDPTTAAGYRRDPKLEEDKASALDPTADHGNVSALELQGTVTTDPDTIAKWIRDGADGLQINVIFGTYQSGHQVAEALKGTGVTAKVLIGDEAHRTAGLRRKRNANPGEVSGEEQRIRDFTLCHDNDAFPTTYRVYQTATPRIYDTRKATRDLPSDWIVRSMDDEKVFGVELYRKSYVEAVDNGWLSDYRIIAVGVNDPDAFNTANELAANTQSKGRNALTTSHYQRGLAFALALGGAVQGPDGETVSIASCIAFMNTVDKSKNMANDLGHDKVKDWVQRWLNDNAGGRRIAAYDLEHLDASNNTAAREGAKLRLKWGTEDKPHGIINVGIFGEGTDSPSLNAVAFLEPRKSPIDVIQAVGRAMRTAEGKKVGYIICPILIPANADPERWLSSSGPEDGWEELGQILLALRAHDQRIEDRLEHLIHLQLPREVERLSTLVAIASGEGKRIRYFEHTGAPGEAEDATARTLKGESTVSREFHPMVETSRTDDGTKGNSDYGQVGGLFHTGAGELEQIAIEKERDSFGEPAQIIAGKKNVDGSIEIRMDSVARGKPLPDGTPGPLDIRRSKAKAKEMINKGTGIRVDTNRTQRTRRTAAEIAEQSAMRMLRLSGLEEYGSAIKMNLLSKSGLSDNRVIRDLNILENSVKEATHHLRADELKEEMDRHFGIDRLNENNDKKQADGCTIAALLMMNAAMLHQRISNGQWLTGINDLSTIKNATNVINMVLRQWSTIMAHDFLPVIEPAVKAINAIEDTGRTAGLERALRHIAAEAERIAETYADMGADHAGPLFNKVMGNQASDGAYFTRPPAASMAARLTLDACGDLVWTDPRVWREHKTVDLACGSGTLLTAMLTDMKRRAQEQGANRRELADLQKLAVEEVLKGLDINPVSLQLAASQLTAGNEETRYRRMGLHLMPYGPQTDRPGQVAVGTLELLGQRGIVERPGELDLGDDLIESRRVWEEDDAELEDAVSAVKDTKIVIMNPPFSSRKKMGEKFPQTIKTQLQRRVDAMEAYLTNADEEMIEFTDKNALEPLFTALAEKCTMNVSGVLTMINPTLALCAPSAIHKRRILSQRYHIHTVLTSHQPGQVNLSQNAGINESIIVARRQQDPKPPTKFISLDRIPTDESEVAELHKALCSCHEGEIADGWGEISYWPAERMAEGDWTPAVWRSPELAEAAHNLSTAAKLPRMDEKYTIRTTLQELYASCKLAEEHEPGSFPVIASKSSDGQMTLQSRPDQYWIPKNAGESRRLANGGTYPEADKILQKAAHLMITHGQNNSTARVTAVAADQKHVGTGWMPVLEPSLVEAKALAVFLNSTAGRLQIMRNPGTTLVFPLYNPAGLGTVRVPDVLDDSKRDTLVDCWEKTKDMEVPQFRDGECEVRRLWDEAVAEVMGWDSERLSELRHLLHQEPHVRGLGYNQYADEIDDEQEEML